MGTKLTKTQSAIASIVEDLTGYSIRKSYCKDEQLWGFDLLDPCGDSDGGLWFCFKDLLHHVANEPSVERELMAEGLL